MVETKPWAIALVAFCTLITATGQLLFKLGLNKLDLSLLGLITNYTLILGFFLYGIGAAMLIISLKYGELSVLYPIVSLSFVWVTILSFSVLNEHIGFLKFLGVLFIILGVSFIGRSGNTTKAKLKIRG